MSTELLTLGIWFPSLENMGGIANFVDLKNQITLLKAVHRLSEHYHLRLRLVGSGPTLPQCIHYVQQHGLTHIVSFEQEVHHDKLADFYHAIDLFVLPSYFEGFGCVYLEAAACDVPFMACEGQGIDDYIIPEERHLWLCHPKDEIKLAGMLEYYIKNRPKQSLIHRISINDIIGHFLDHIQKGDENE